jgi:hypothetical protein
MRPAEGRCGEAFRVAAENLTSRQTASLEVDCSRLWQVISSCGEEFEVAADNLELRQTIPSHREILPIAADEIELRWRQSSCGRSS